MRNLKKFLALVLAMMMVFSLMVTVNAKTLDDYNDVDAINDDYKLAVNILTQLDILEGKGGSTFDPKGELTRSEAAAIVYRLATGDVKDDQASAWASLDIFSDLDEAKWAAGYINYAASRGIVVGTGGNQFTPLRNITGLELLTILLRVIGYGKNGEYQGANWSGTLIEQAAQLGLIKGITGKDLSLGEPITREVMAQILCNAMTAKLINWNGAYYEKTSDDLIDLEEDVDIDAWGVPSRVITATWNLADHKETVTIGYDLVADFNIAIDECDIIDDVYDMGFNVKEGKIAAFYVDGNEMDVKEATTGGDDTIEEQGVEETMGGQGVWTRIFETPSGEYWVVEINTWLAKVTKVTEPEPDKNGHVGRRQIELQVYVGDAGAENDVKILTTTVNNDVYEKNQYVLVIMNQPEDKTENATVGAAATGTDPESDDSDPVWDTFKAIEIVDRAPIVVTGSVTDWDDADYPDPAVHYIDKKDHPDAEKFFLNWREDDTTWAAYGDLDGNIIGLVDASADPEYAILTAIVWNNTGLRGSHAEANLLLPDGTTREAVTVARLNGAVAGNKDEQQMGTDLDFDDSDIHDYVRNNSILFNHIVEYTVDEETGAYSIAFPNETGTVDTDWHTADYDVSPAFIFKGQPSIYKDDGNGDFDGAATDIAMTRGNDYTVYFVENEDGELERYVGMDNVPTVAGDVCYVEGVDGYASLVVVTGLADDDDDTGYVLAYVADIQDSVAANKDLKGEAGKFAEVTVFPLGSDKGQKLYIPSANLTDWTTTVTATGIYEFELDDVNKGIVASGGVDQILDDVTPTAYSAAVSTTNDTKLKFVELGVMVDLKGNALYTDQADFTPDTGTNEYLVVTPGTTDDENYRVTDATIVVVTKSNTNGDSAIDETDAATVKVSTDKTVVEENDIVIVGYYLDGKVNDAKYVYVFKTDAPKTNEPEPQGDLVIVSGTNTDYKALTGIKDATVKNLGIDAYEFTTVDNEGGAQFTGMGATTDATGWIFFVYKDDKASYNGQHAILTIMRGDTLAYFQEATVPLDGTTGGHFFYIEAVGNGDTATPTAQGDIVDNGAKPGTYDWRITIAGDVVASGSYVLDYES